MTVASLSIPNLTTYPCIASDLHKSAGIREMSLDDHLPKDASDQDRRKYRAYEFAAAEIAKHYRRFAERVKDNLGVPNNWHNSYTSRTQSISRQAAIKKMFRLISGIAKRDYLTPMLQDLNDKAYGFLPVNQFNFLAGVHNHIETTLCFVAMLPQIYKREFGSELSREEYSRMAHNLLPMMKDFAMMHLNLFFKDIRATVLKLTGIMQSDLDLGGILKFFRLVNLEDQGLTLAPSEELVRIVKKEAGDEYQGELALGCPAHYARAQADDGTESNVLDAMFRWMMKVLDKYYFPYWGNKVRSTDE